MAIIIQTIKEEKVVQVTFRSNSNKEYRLLLNKETGIATVYTDYIKYMHYGYEKTGNAYKVFTGAIQEVTKVDLMVFLSQFK